MANGFAPFLLKSLEQVVGQNTPQTKLNYQGYLNMLLAQDNARVVRLNSPTNEGHRKSVQIKRKKRFNTVHVDNQRSCDNINLQPWEEQTVPLTIFRQLAIHVEDETIARYPEEASKSTMIGQPPTALMEDLIDSIRTGSDALLSSLNQALFTLAATNIGVNVTTGVVGAKTVNFPLNTTNNPLNSGINVIQTDFQTNEATGRPQMVGSGILHSFFMQQASKSPDQSGLNTTIQAAQGDFFYDTFAETALGTDQAIIYEPNAVQLVEYMNYKGFKAGEKLTSIFFTFMLPMVVKEQVRMVEFDAQLRYVDCPTTETDAYYGTSISLQKGWSIIISKEAGLFTIEDAYRGTDRLSGNRGSYRYLFTNT